MSTTVKNGTKFLCTGPYGEVREYILVRFSTTELNTCAYYGLIDVDKHISWCNRTLTSSSNDSVILDDLRIHIGHLIKNWTFKDTGLPLAPKESVIVELGIHQAIIKDSTVKFSNGIVTYHFDKASIYRLRSCKSGWLTTIRGYNVYPSGLKIGDFNFTDKELTKFFSEYDKVVK